MDGGGGESEVDVRSGGLWEGGRRALLVVVAVVVVKSRMECAA